MKHLILLTGILLIKISTATIVSIDSIVPTRDSSIINLITDSCFEAEPILTTKVESNVGKAQKQHAQKLAACWLCDVASDIGSGISNVFSGGLWKNTWGYYEEGGQKATGPYTVFSRDRLSHYDQLTQLRSKILSPNGDSTYFFLYLSVLEKANNPTTQYCNDKESPRSRGRFVRV
jgi:hypothetical protein